jgi:hypothetical protein
MDGAAVDFALTRFETVEGARLEVEGTWSGVRGVRFVRPALVVGPAAAGGAERTLLATLDHKPWPAEEGRPWVAAFPWDGGEPDVARLQLAVAPSIVVPLGGAPEEAARDDVAVAVPAPAPAPAPRRGDGAEARVAAALASRDAAREERDAAREDLAALAGERDAAVAAAEAARAEAARRPDRETVRGELRQRDEALAARDSAVAERDAALAQRDDVARERDALRRELRDREQAADGAARRREQALEERDAARRALEAQRAETEAAAERAAGRERQRAAERIGAVQGELADAQAARDRALVQPAGVAAPTPVARVPREHAAASSRADWAARTAAILALLVLLVLAVTFLKAIA